jgi:hypothetical protein
MALDPAIIETRSPVVQSLDLGELVQQPAKLVPPPFAGNIGSTQIDDIPGDPAADPRLLLGEFHLAPHGVRITAVEVFAPEIRERHRIFHPVEPGADPSSHASILVGEGKPESLGGRVGIERRSKVAFQGRKSAGSSHGLYDIEVGPAAQYQTKVLELPVDHTPGALDLRLVQLKIQSLHGPSSLIDIRLHRPQCQIAHRSTTVSNA